MAFQSVPETAEIVINYFGNSSNMVNVVAAKKVGGYTLADIQSLAAAVGVSVVAQFLPEQSLKVAYVSTVVRGLQNENDLEATDTVGAGPGGLVDVGTAGNVTLSIKKSSGFTGRSARGRMYWIGMSTTILTANKNRVDQAAADNLVAKVEALRLAIVTEGWAPVIISRFALGVKRVTGVTFPWDSTSSVNLDVDSQRRRLI